MTNSLPHAQHLLEKYRGDERVRIVAVATAFEKEQYPWMADEDGIRGRLKQEGWTFPVMRDRDEKSVRIVGVNGSYGTPLTVVLDQKGVVRWHGFNPTEQTAVSVEGLVGELLESFYVPAIADLPRELRDYEKGNFGKAWTAAERILQRENGDEEVAGKARQVQANIQKAVDGYLNASQALAEEGRPAGALAELENAEKIFQGTGPAGEAKSRRSELKTDAAFKKELAGEKRLDQLLTDAGKRKVNVRSLLSRARSLEKSHGETRLGPRIAELIADLEARG